MSLTSSLSKSSNISKINHFLEHQFKTSKFLGYVSVLAASLLAGMADVIPKPILGDNLDPFFVSPVLLVFIIYLANSIFFSGLTKNKGTFTRLRGKNVFLLISIGVAEAAGTIVYYLGLKETSAINASILGNGETIFAILIAMMIFRERIQKFEILPLVLIIFGAVLLPSVSDFFENGMILSELVFGDVLILASGAFYAIDVTLSKFVCQKIDSKKIMQISSISACVFSLLIILLFGLPIEFELTHLPVMLTTGIFGMGLSSILFIIALRLIGAVRSILIYSTTTIFGIVFAVFYLSETVSVSNVVCVFAVIAGIYFLRKKLSKDED